MRLLQIEKEPFIFRSQHFVTPTVRFRLVANISSKDDERIAMIAIAAEDFKNCVTTGEQDGEGQCDGEVGSARCADRTPRRGGPYPNRPFLLTKLCLIPPFSP